MKPTRDYLEFNPSVGWPAGGGIFYECLKCGAAIPTNKDGSCECGNLYIDASCGRVGAKDPSLVRPFRYQ